MTHLSPICQICPQVCRICRFHYRDYNKRLQQEIMSETVQKPDNGTCFASTTFFFFINRIDSAVITPTETDTDDGSAVAKQIRVSDTT